MDTKKIMLIFGIVLLVLVSCGSVSATNEVLLASVDTERSTASDTYVLLETIDLSANPNVVTRHQNQIRVGGIDVVDIVYCKVEWTYEDDTTNEVEQTNGDGVNDVTYVTKNYTNPDLTKSVKTVKVYLHESAASTGYMKFQEVWGYNSSTQTITANATTPDPALPTSDWQVNITATDNDNATFTAYTQFYINTTISGSEVSQAISNNSNTLIATLAHANFNNGATLTAEVWLGDGETNSTKTNITALADITNPVITPDDLGLNLTLIYADSSSNLTGQINSSDPNLYSINISIDDVSIFNTTGLTSTPYVYNLSENVSSYGSGLHNISVRVCDGHTDISLKDKWDYDISLGSLTFKDSKDNKKWYRINPTNNDLFESISTTKLTDRYTFEYSKSAIGKVLTGDTYTFIVESSEYIDIINRQDSKYNAWMVIPSMERWIDFNLKGF